MLEAVEECGIPPQIPPATPGGREGRSLQRGLGGEGNGVERPPARRGPGAAAPESLKDPEIG